MNSRCRLLAVAFVLCLATQMWAANPWADQARDFGSRIASLTGPGTASLSIKNSSSIPNEQVTGIRRAIEAQLKANGVQLRENDVTSEVRITLSENARALVWIAEVQQGSETRVALLEIPLAQVKSKAPAVAPITLLKSLLLSQTAPILDALVLPGPRLVVLDPSFITLYDQVGGKWQLAQVFSVIHAAPFPRDLRGRLVPAADHPFDAFLPGVVCSAAPKFASSECHASDDPWPLGAQSAFFNSARNYFTGLMRPGFAKQLPPFYSAAVLPREKYSLWIFAGADNQMRTWDGVNLRTMGNSTRDWGSDVASIRSNCGVGTQLIVSAVGDDTAADSLRVFEVVDREPALVAAPLSFEGPVGALWPSPDQTSAVAIIHNLRQGTYDAYSVSISCAQ